MRPIPPLVDKRVLRPAQTALALDLVNELDLLRLKAIARLYARGLPVEVTWEDLLQEALTRVLVGSRCRPDGVSTVAFLAGVMRSLRSDYRRRVARESAGEGASWIERESVGSRTLDLAVTRASSAPERDCTTQGS